MGWTSVCHTCALSSPWMPACWPCLGPHHIHGLSPPGRPQASRERRLWSSFVPLDHLVYTACVRLLSRLESQSGIKERCRTPSCPSWAVSVSPGEHKGSGLALPHTWFPSLDLSL